MTPGIEGRALATVAHHPAGRPLGSCPSQPAVVVVAVVVHVLPLLLSFGKQHLAGLVMPGEVVMERK